MLTNFLENKFLDILFGRGGWSGKPTSLYMALFTTTPGDDGTGGVEVAGSGYARVAVSVAAGTKWTVAAGSATNAEAITWNVASASWGNIASIGIYSALSGGTLLAVIPLSLSVQVDQFNQFKIDTGGLSLTIAGAVGTYAANAFLNHWLNGVAMPVIANIYVALGLGVTADGVVDSEPLTYGYERKGIVNSSGNFPAAASGSKAINNTHAFQTNSTNAWPQVTHMCLMDTFWGQRVASTQNSVNTITTTSTNLFQNGDRVVFIKHDLSTTQVEGSTLYPNRVFFVRDRTSTTFKAAATSGGSALVLAAATPSASVGPTAYLCDAASIAVTATSGSAALAATAHGLKVGDIVAFCPNDFASPASTTYPTTLALNTSPTAAQEIRFVVAVTDDTFQLSATRGGSALTPGSSQSFSVCRLNRGNVLWQGAMTNALNIASGDTAQVLDDSMSLTLD